MSTKPAEKPCKRDPVVPLLAELVSRGDGTYVLKPKVPDHALDTWITIREVTQILGIRRPNNIYPLLGEYLVYRRPLPARIVVSLKSALALKQATQDPDFWENQILKEQLKETVRKAMALMVEEANPAAEKR